ncbi:MAG TPA: helix-turn-helix domain-containing protein [Miltoncostaeaceae bacterium]|nr:helix-turn-helix domain-containing protein [Miltoncostaeaceae bacterium]
MKAVSVAERAGAECPVVATARIVSGKWTLVLLRDLAEGPRRFGELERSLAGISPGTLTQRLRALEALGIVARTEGAPRADYVLTDKGRHLVPIVEAMREYGTRWLRDDALGC